MSNQQTENQPSWLELHGEAIIAGVKDLEESRQNFFEKVYEFNFQDDDIINAGDEFEYDPDLDITTITQQMLQAAAIFRTVRDSEGTRFMIDANINLYDFDPLGRPILRKHTHAKYEEGKVNYYDDDGDVIDPYL